ncbi:hypothetical protein Hanom_Chr07g00620081 [Helianthus anomalus]
MCEVYTHKTKEEKYNQTLYNWGSPVGHRYSPLLRGTGFKSWEWHMSPRVRTRHGEVTAELAWSGSGSRSEITPAVGRTVHLLKIDIIGSA